MKKKFGKPCNRCCSILVNNHTWYVKHNNPTGSFIIMFRDNQALNLNIREGGSVMNTWDNNSKTWGAEVLTITQFHSAFKPLIFLLHLILIMDLLLIIKVIILLYFQIDLI